MLFHNYYGGAGWVYGGAGRMHLSSDHVMGLCLIKTILKYVCNVLVSPNVKETIEMELVTFCTKQ